MVGSRAVEQINVPVPSVFATPEKFSEEVLADLSVTFVREYGAASRTMLVALGGMKRKPGIVPFEFGGVTAGLPVKKLYFREPNRIWYRRGLAGVAPNLDAIAGFIRAEVKAQQIERLVMIGNSMGGYAAILFGCLAEADEVHAFSPQTFLSFWLRLRLGDKRWTRLILKRRFAPGWPAYSDLRPVVLEKNPRTNLYLHYSTASQVDTRHVERLAGLPGVHLRAHAEGGHRVVTQLRATGELETILRVATAGP